MRKGRCPCGQLLEEKALGPGFARANILWVCARIQTYVGLGFRLKGLRLQGTYLGLGFRLVGFRLSGLGNLLGFRV